MKSRLVILILLGIVLFVSSRAILHSQLFPLHDYVHGARIVEMHRAISDGHIPPRWSANFGYGYGMPLFLFYAPLPYYVGALFFGLGLSLVSSVQILLISANLITVLGAYLMGRTIAGRWVGLVSAALYTLAPYRAVNLFVRGAISEAWGMAFLPWIVLGWLMMIKKQKFAWLVLTVSTAAVFLSHNLTALIFFPFFAIIVFAHWLWTSRDWILLTKISASIILGFGLASYYVLPAILESKYTQLHDLVLTGYFDFHLHFLYLRQFFADKWQYGGSQWGPDDGMSFFLGFGLLLAVAIGIATISRHFWLHRWRSKQAAWFSTGLISLTAIAMLLTTQKTLLLWELVPMLSYLQFPWRYLLLINLLLILTVAVSWRLLPVHVQKPISVLVVVVSLVTSWRYFKPIEYLSDSSGLYYEAADRISSHMSDVLPDYIPAKFTLKNQPAESRIYSFSSGDEPEILVNRTHEILLAPNNREDGYLTLAISDFPGWKAEIDGEVVDHQTTSEGLISVNVPAGAKLVAARFTNTPVRTAADILTAVSVVIVVTVIIISSNPKNTYGRKHI